MCIRDRSICVGSHQPCRRCGRATTSAGRAPAQRALHVPLAQAVANAVHVVAVAHLTHADCRPDHLCGWLRGLPRRRTNGRGRRPVSYTHLRAHETSAHL
eukprot:7057534-Alexandrium_andersonii.AAC.1